MATSDAERAIQAVLRELDTAMDTQVQAEWEAAIEGADEGEDEAFAWQSLARLSSIRVPRIRVPSFRVPNVRVPKVRVPSARLSGGRLPRGAGGRPVSARPARGRSAAAGRSSRSRSGRRTFRSEMAAGFRPQHLPHLRRLLGQPFTSPANRRLASLWRRAAKPGEAATLDRDNSRLRFNLHRRRFWAAVRRDPQARRLFTNAGFRFGPRPESAPYRTLADGRRMTVTIDHMIERQTAPERALDPANLRLSPRRENTVLLRQITERNKRFHGV